MGEWSHQLQNVKRQDFHYDIIYSDGGPTTSGRVREDIKTSVEDARRMKRTERVIVPPSALLPTSSYARFSRPFIDNPRVLIRIPIFRFNTMFPCRSPTLSSAVPASSSHFLFLLFHPGSCPSPRYFPPNGLTVKLKLSNWERIKRPNFARAGTTL